MKIIKLTFLIIAFLFSVNCIIGQKNHEIKLDLVAINNNYIVNYESIITNRISVEIGLGLDFRDLFLTNFNVTSFPAETSKFSATFLSPNIGGKYYLVVAESGSGVYFGPYARWTYLLSREDGYVEKWEEIFDTQATERVKSDSGIRTFQYGFQTGAKLIMKQHYLIEFNIAYTLERQVGIEARENIIRNTNYSIRFGYRW